MYIPPQLTKCIIEVGACRFLSYKAKLTPPMKAPGYGLAPAIIAVIQVPNQPSRFRLAVVRPLFYLGRVGYILMPVRIVMVMPSMLLVCLNFRLITVLDA